MILLSTVTSRILSDISSEKGTVTMIARGLTREELSAALRAFLRRWKLPNGLLRAMSAATHNYRGGWTESLGIVGALADMLMTCVGGVVRLFSGIPAEQNASFQNLRAEGAFLLGARKSASVVETVHIFSERGGTLKLENPWFPCDCLLAGTAGEPRRMNGQTLELVFSPGEQIEIRRC